ncbi:Uncharacterized membrane protein YphA, DoxX/SURF4 family [bacterium A37T11]|nr:Uncharacterized membrane protein YphA, DoxX/SURF4 family [bacterium A37T11]
MSVITKIQDWGDQHHAKWLDYFRIVLGVVLIWKGVAFATNLHAFTTLMTHVMVPVAISLSLLAHLIILLHILGGLMIALGSNTRLFCLLNLPVLLVAVFFVNFQQNIFRPYSEMWLSVIVLFGLLLFMVEGDGKLSIERGGKKVIA